MAKRSDFAQKLLDDLRLRKERMAVAQGTGRSNTDANGRYQQTYRGSRDIKTQGTVGSRTGNMHKKSNGGTRSLTIEQASNQIVPFHRGQNTEQRGDLSMALAFAIENGGKLSKMDSSGNHSILGFLQQIGRRTVDFGKIERRGRLDRHKPSTSQFPTLSHIHIKEISKGAQKLNQILRACSNGIKFDEYSIDIGKELLKGAMDLEESLRMLVNLQEASDYMTTPQRKCQIKLLEVDEDEDENKDKIAEEKQVDRPRFSFDKPSKNSHGMQEVVKNGVKQKLTALIYPSQSPKYNHGKQALNSASHKQSASCSPDFKTLAAFTEDKKNPDSSQSKSEKGKISNVIARLMGLEVLPENIDSKYTKKKSSSKQNIEGTVLKKTAQGSTINAELKTKNTETLASQSAKQKQMKANKILETRDTALMLQPEQNLVTCTPGFNLVVHDGKPPWKRSESMEGVMQATSSKKANIKMNKQQRNRSNLSQITGSRKDIQEKKSNPENGKEKVPRGMVLVDEHLWAVQHTQKSSEAANTSQERTGLREIVLQVEKRNANKLLSDKHQNNLELQQLCMPQKPDSQEETPTEKTKQQSAKQKPLVTKQKGNQLVFNSSPELVFDARELPKKQPYMNQAMFSKRSSTEVIDTTPSKGLPDGRQKENFVRERNSTNFKVSMKDSMNRSSDQNAFLRDQETESKRAKARVPQHLEEKHIHVLSTLKKVDSKKVHKSEIPRKIHEVMTKRIGTLHNSKLQDMKQRRQNKVSGIKRVEQMIPKAEVSIIKSSELEESTQSLDVVSELPKEGEQASTLNDSISNEFESPKESCMQNPNQSSQNTTSAVSKDQWSQEPSFGRDQELKNNKIISMPPNGNQERSTKISYSSQVQHQVVSESWTQEPLTENENHLKQILMTSQLFLNTAEALFKLNIPVGLLYSGGHHCQDEESKFTLDCGYEIMRRRGRRQELTAYPYGKTTVNCFIKIRSLDDLIKQLHIDLENLKYYSRVGCSEADAADYLYKMLERDVQSKDPDVNCMWDLGWNETMFTFFEKDEVIRDVERQMLNGLIDEITREFLHVSVSV